jgi:hypothetical protein
VEEMQRVMQEFQEQKIPKLLKVTIFFHIIKIIVRYWHKKIKIDLKHSKIRLISKFFDISEGSSSSGRT